MGVFLKRGERSVAGKPYHKSYELGDQIHKPPTLKGLHVSNYQSHRWQKMAELDENVFEGYVYEAKKKKT